MGHLAGKDVYRSLGKKLDGLTVRIPHNEALHAVLAALYSRDEADLVVKMPYRLSSLRAVARATGLPEEAARARLEVLADKGLVVDLCVRDRWYYMPSPLIVGIFEFTMMRTRGELDTRRWAELLHAYMHGTDALVAANRGRVGVMRSMPHEQALRQQDHSEILDYERARAVVEGARRFAVGICSCRHEKHHLGDKRCEVPLETCTTFDTAADYLVRHGFGRMISKEEMLERIARSWETGLVLNADNVQQRVSFICHCCACCCNALESVARTGYTGILVTSSYLAFPDYEQCTGCGNCACDCPIQAITMQPAVEEKFRKHGKPVVDESFCLGCGVCTRRCKSASLTLAPRPQRVLHPETTFERVILQCLERGTLQNQIFADPSRITHSVMRGVLGGFLRLSPVKRALMSESLRSRFLAAIKGRARTVSRGVADDL